MWTEFRMTPWGKAEPPFRSGEEFRQWAAKVLPNNHSLAFWRKPGPGDPLPGMPAITFLRSKNSLLLRVYGPAKDSPVDYGEAVAAAGNAVLALLPLLTEHTGQRIHLNHSAGEHRIVERDADRPQQYHIYRLALPRNRHGRAKEQWKRLMGLAAQVKDAGPEGVPVAAEDYPLITRTIQHAIQDVAGDDKYDVVPRATRKITIIGQPQWGAPVRVGNELVFTVRKVRFELPCRLEGKFQVGGLRSRGFGDACLVLSEENQQAKEVKCAS